MTGVADRLLLDVANRRRLGADLTRAVLGVERGGSMEGAPGITVTIDDPGERLMESRVLTRPAIRALGTPAANALRPIDVLYDGVWFRLNQASRVGDGVRLTFDHRGAVYMSRHDSPMSASRNDRTRALFIRRQVFEVARRRGAGHKLAFWAPEVRRRMPIAAPDSLSSRSEENRDVAATNERAKDAKGLKVKGVAANPEQRRNMAIAAEVADAEETGPRATLALFVAGIGESDFEHKPNAAGSPYTGVWQSHHRYKHSVREQARLFLRGGEGFQQGGAIALARREPHLTPGEIATRVEASGKPGSFYDAYRREAERAIAALGGIALEPGEGGSYVKPYRFRRPRGEDAWTNTGNLATEVQRRRFVTVPARGVDLFVYSDDEHLLALRSQAVLDPGARYVDTFEYDLDYGKTVRAARMVVRGKEFDQDFPWGLPVTLEDAGPASGKWLVWETREVDGSPWVELDLRQPQEAAPEPASERVQRNDSDSVADDDGSATSKVYARAKAISDRNLPYVWGGGHARAGQPSGGGYDCSGYAAACLLAGDMLPTAWKGGVPASGSFASDYGEPGEGERITVWANAGHMFIEFKLSGKRGKWADTSRAAGGPAGPHLRYGKRTTAGFTARHWPGT